jgi:hypothetical protein
MRPAVLTAFTIATALFMENCAGIEIAKCFQRSASLLTSFCSLSGRYSGYIVTTDCYSPSFVQF